MWMVFWWAGPAWTRKILARLWLPDLVLSNVFYSLLNWWSYKTEVLKLIANIRTLRIVERIRLVEDIWDSIASDQRMLTMTDEQMAELDRRLDAYESDGIKGRTASVVIADIRKRLWVIGYIFGQMRKRILRRLQNGMRSNVKVSAMSSLMKF